MIRSVLASSRGLGSALASVGGGAAFAGAYDAIPDLVHIYEVARRTLTAYEGNLVRLRRSSDNAELDFGFAANGDLDTAAITTWLGGASGLIVTVYDQVGSNNPTQATAGNQPAYVASGQNGRPVMRLDGSSDYLQCAFSGALSQPFTVYAVAKAASTAAQSSLIDGNTAQRMLLRITASATWQIFAGAILNSSAANVIWNVWSVLFNGVSSQFWHNNVSKATGNAGADNAVGIVIGAQTGGDTPWNGDIAAIAISDPSHNTAEREAMQDAINDYWSVF